MTGQVDENIDLIGLDLLAQLVVGGLSNVAPPIGRALEILGEFILDKRGRVAGDLEPAFIVVE